MKAISLIISTVFICASHVLAAQVTVNTADQLGNSLIRYAPGDSIYLSAGIFTGYFSIEKRLTIIGAAGSVIDGGGEGDVITIAADSVEIKGITIRNSGTRLLKDMAGIKIVGNYVTIEDCRIIDNLHGIYVKGGNNAVIRGNTIIGRDYIQESDRGNGIHLWSTEGNIIENNEISFARDGIYFSFAHETLIKNNHIHDLRYGLHYMYSNENIFEDNLFDYNVAGSALMYSENIHFERNVFAHCRGFRAYGILLQSVDNCTAEGNLVIDNTRGVFLDDSNHNIFKSNDIVQNDLAVQVNASCENNILAGNNFISNLSMAMMDGSAIDNNAWNENGRGNYWSDYNGYDLDFDGLGDIPHDLSSLFEFMESDYPAIRFYLYSPAASLLEAAEKRLPILKRKAVEDDYPVFRIIDNRNASREIRDQHQSAISLAHITMWFLFLILPAGILLRLGR